MKEHLVHNRRHSILIDHHPCLLSRIIAILIESAVVLCVDLDIPFDGLVDVDSDHEVFDVGELEGEGVYVVVAELDAVGGGEFGVEDGGGRGRGVGRWGLWGAEGKEG